MRVGNEKENGETAALLGAQVCFLVDGLFVMEFWVQGSVFRAQIYGLGLRVSRRIEE